ncbi:hypothetical protein [Pseudofulvimonas gallinarii]
MTAECASPRLAQDPQPDRISVRIFDLRAIPVAANFDMRGLQPYSRKAH